MIRWVTPELTPQLIQNVENWGVFGTKIYTQYQTYGVTAGIFDLWLLFAGERTVGAISRAEGLVTVAALPETDWVELEAFLSVAGGWAVEGEADVIAPLRLQGRMISGEICRYAGAGFPVNEGKLTRADSLREVYELLCEVDGEFAAGSVYDAWLTEVSHKVRHGLAEIYVVKMAGKTIATVGIYFKDQKRAILAGLATAERVRGHGIGKEVMREITEIGRKAGLEMWLMTAEEGMTAFHGKCGYCPAGRWTRVTRDPTAPNTKV